MITSIPVGTIFGILGVTNTFGDYTELNIYPMPSWAKYCDGSQIIDEDSPINGKYVPDLINKVIVASATAGTTIPKKIIYEGFTNAGIWQQQTVVSNLENMMTIKYFMRIK
jgi:hypothetical protein